MPLFTKESLETLRERIDLIEVLEPHLDLKRAGSSYKACCPFHDEKTPSFVIKQGDSHYHCFGCGAHGDAIAFLMNHLQLSFTDSVEQLAERFSVRIERIENKDERQGPTKQELRAVNEQACAFFEAYLLHTDEGHNALQYLYDRGLDLDFIRAFRIGYAPHDPALFGKAIKSPHLLTVGLLNQKGFPFFRQRIIFPIQDAPGHIIGFSGRKIRSDAFGPKYMNTPETPLFKKSKILFGLHQSRKRIARDKKAIICEGQIDALRLIHAGFDYAVAGQGTAFGEEQAHDLMNLGVQHVYLALDGDDAGEEAAIKIGHFFQKEGVDVSVLAMPASCDPDTLLREEGPPAFQKLLTAARDYLTFLVDHHSRGVDLSRPAVKTEIVQKISQRIRQWNHPLMIHESLRKLAKLTHVPESTIGVDQTKPVGVIIKKSGSVASGAYLDPHRILETDLLRWMLLLGQNHPELVELICRNLTRDHFQTPLCRDLFVHIIEEFDKGHSCDLLSLSISIDNPEEQLLLSDLLQKKVNLDRAQMGVEDTVKRLLERRWLMQREEIKAKIHLPGVSDDEVLDLAKEFDRLKANPPKLK